MTEEKDSPWYTSAWIFRQKVHDDWTYVIKNVIEDLQKYGN